MVARDATSTMDSSTGVLLGSTHLTIAAALFAWSREYKDLTEVYEKGSKGIKAVLVHIETTIAKDLRAKIDPIVKAKTSVAVILDVEGVPVSRAGTPTDSEEYRAAFVELMEARGAPIVRYVELRAHRDGWCNAIRTLSIVLPVSTSVEAILGGGIFVVAALLKKDVWNWFAYTSLVVLTTVLFAAATLYLRAARHQREVMVHLQRHDS